MKDRRLSDISARLWAKVDRSGGPDACWPWTGAPAGAGYKTGTGYGYIATGRRHDLTRYRAHRLAWILTRSPIPAGVLVLHRCDNTLCCNPDHLFLGTDADNMADRDAKGRQSRGEQNGSKLTREQVLAIRALLGSGVSGRECARRFGVQASTIRHIRWRHTWAWLPDAKPTNAAT